eukprot:SAG31_NODE_7804_length_1593_cov_1.980589_2_plen_129_part_00
MWYRAERNIHLGARDRHDRYVHAQAQQRTWLVFAARGQNVGQGDQGRQRAHWCTLRLRQAQLRHHQRHQGPKPRPGGLAATQVGASTMVAAGHDGRAHATISVGASSGHSWEVNKMVGTRVIRMQAST